MKYLPIIIIALIALYKSPLVNTDLVLCDMNMPVVAYATYCGIASIVYSLGMIIYEFIIKQIDKRVKEVTTENTKEDDKVQK